MNRRPSEPAGSDGASSARSPAAPIRIGVSTCLLGQPVRFDAGHKRDGFLVDVLGPYVEWVPVCPEVEIGLGTPRPTMRLERADSEVRLVTPSSGADHTLGMRRYAERRVRALAADDLCGYVLKKDSPSCGMERVRVYHKGMPERGGRGLFAEALLRHFPHLPVEEEGRLNDPHLRESFIERIFAYRRLRTFFKGRWTVGGLVAFHTTHKLQILSHSPSHYETLGRLVAGAKGTPREAVRDAYQDGFMNALAIPATTRRHVNVLQHITGYFRDRLDPAPRAEVAAVIDDYRRGLLPLIVPITLVRHYVRLLDVTYLQDQVYLAPHPKELMLRNRV